MIAGIVNEALFWLMGEGGLDCYVETPCWSCVTDAIMSECQAAYDKWMDIDEPWCTVFEYIEREVLQVALDEYKIYWHDEKESD